MWSPMPDTLYLEGVFGDRSLKGYCAAAMSLVSGVTTDNRRYAVGTMVIGCFGLLMLTSFALWTQLSPACQ